MKELLILLLTISVGLSGLAMNRIQEKENGISGHFQSENLIEKFWSWFKENESRLRKFEETPGKYLDELLVQAKKIQRGLAIELEPPRDGIINLTVSADGDRNLFIVVKTIIDKAPKIAGWNFIAFRQRMSMEQIKQMKVKAQDHDLDPGKMKFFPIVEGDTLDLIIYVSGLTAENYNQIAYGGFLLLDNILGEYDCVTKVRSYDFHNMPAKKEELNGLLSLLELAAYVDKFHSSSKN